MSENPSIAIINAVVIAPDEVIENAAVGVREGRIAEVSRDGNLLGDYESTIDARGAYVMPGIIDLHNDSLEIEVNPRPETNLPVDFALANLERRLLFSGVTTEFHAVAFMDNPRAGRTTARGAQKAAFLAEHRRSGRQLIDNQVLHRLDVWSPDSLPYIFESLDRLDTRYVSINDHTPGQGQYRDLEAFKLRMQAWQDQRGRGPDVRTAEERMQERAADTETVPMVYARITEERERRHFTIASHDDDSPEKVEMLHGLGAGITEFPVDVESARKAKELGMWSMVGAPNIVRGGSSSGNQSAAELFSLGLADVICADYHAPSMLPAAFKLVDDGIAELTAAMRALTLQPGKGRRAGRARRHRAGTRGGHDHRAAHRPRHPDGGARPAWWCGCILPATSRGSGGASVTQTNSKPASGQGRMLGEQPWVHETSRITQSELGPWTAIGPNCTISESTFGDYSYCAGDVSIIYSEVGKFCSIASHVRLNPGNHPMNRVTQHHMTYRRRQYGFGDTDDAAFFDWRRADKVTVGHDVWLGHGVLVMPGVSIGTGAVVGAGAVVTKDIEPYMVAVGVPAKPLRPRFPADVVEKLMAIAWWDWPREVLEERFEELNDLEAFLEKYG